jgi:hypothetical protein
LSIRERRLFVCDVDIGSDLSEGEKQQRNRGTGKVKLKKA